MSGWDGYGWAAIVLGAFMIVMGVLNLLVPFRQVQGQARDLQLRHGDGAADLSRVRRNERLGGVASIGFGVMALLNPGMVPRTPAFLIGMGGLALAVASWLLLVQPVLDRRRLRRHEAALARLAGASDTYDDALRALHASPPATQAPLRKWLSVSILIPFGGSFLALGITR